MQIISERGISLIKQFEGCKLDSYQDSAGIWTVGYGHVDRNIVRGTRITQHQADQYLDGDLVWAEIAVAQNVTVPLTQNQFDALVSLAFNIGTGNFKKSTLVVDLNSGMFDKAAEQFLLWSHCGGKMIPGLLTRRTAERAMFLEGGAGAE